MKLNKLETLEQEISDYCTKENLPKWHTIDELLQLDLTYNQVKQLYKFKEQLQKYY